MPNYHSAAQLRCRAQHVVSVKDAQQVPCTQAHRLQKASETEDAYKMQSICKNVLPPWICAPWKFSSLLRNPRHPRYKGHEYSVGQSHLEHLSVSVGVVPTSAMDTAACRPKKAARWACHHQTVVFHPKFSQNQWTCMKIENIQNISESWWERMVKDGKGRRFNNA